MKRREFISKLRRPGKRSKFAENLCGSALIYIKFFMLWAVVVVCDFLVDFRFEYLWPFYLVIKSIHDSFKYQGLVFSAFFVFVALTSDMVCYLLLPVHWLFLAASTYVWVQYVWHTDKGLCLPTISLCILFVYVEAAVRFKEIKPLPLHLEVCRSFAAHCVGYPFVTLGFGFKSYVNYKMRLRKQEEVAKENELCMQFMQQTLPIDQHAAVVSCNTLSSALPEDSNLAIAPKVVSTNSFNPSPNQNIQLHPNHSNNINHNKQNKIVSVNSNGNVHHHNSNNQQQQSGSKEFAKDHHQHNKENIKEINKEFTPQNSQPTLLQSKLSDDLDTAKKLTANHCIAKSEFQLIEHQIENKLPNVNEFNEQTEEKPKTGVKSVSNVLSSNQMPPYGASTAATTTNSPQINLSANSPINNNERRGSGGTNSNKWPNSNNFSEILEKPRNSNQHQPTQSPKQNVSNHNGHTAKSSHVADSTTSNNNQVNHSTGKSNNNTRSRSSSNGISVADVANSLNTQQNNHRNGNNLNVSSSGTQRRNKNNFSQTINNSAKDEHISRLEADIKRLKSDLQLAKQTELELQEKFKSLQSKELETRQLYQRLQQDNETLHTKLHNLITARQQDKQNITCLERKLQEERKSKCAVEQQLVQERSQRSSTFSSVGRDGEYSLLNHRTVHQPPFGGGFLNGIQTISQSSQNSSISIASSISEPQCNDSFIDNRHQPTNGYMQPKNQFEFKDDEQPMVDKDLQQLRQLKDCYSDSQKKLLSTVSSLKSKNAELENNLSSETKVKMDLFSALGDTRRQLEICQASLKHRDNEVDELRQKLSEITSLYPAASLNNAFSIIYSPQKYLHSDQSSEHPLDLEMSKNTIENSSSNADWNDLKRKTLLDLNSSVFTSSNGVQSDL